MSDTSNTPTSQELVSSRIIGSVRGTSPGPTVVFMSGMHGNEPAGVLALREVLMALSIRTDALAGKVIGVAGNLKALNLKQRYIQQDLNRMWLPENIQRVQNGYMEKEGIDSEFFEMREILNLFQEIKEEEEDPLTFVDLHTTSAPSVPFVGIRYVEKQSEFFPLPIICGLDDFLTGTLHTYMDELNFSSAVFEAGASDDPSSVEWHKAFIFLSLVYAGCLKEDELPQVKQFYQKLSHISPDRHKVFDIVFRYAIEPGEGFVMDPGYMNFQEIQEGQQLAKNKSGAITAPESGRIFMPLYQKQGDDGFFIIQERA